MDNGSTEMPHLCSTYMRFSNVADVNLPRHDLGEGPLNEPLQHPNRSPQDGTEDEAHTSIIGIREAAEQADSIAGSDRGLDGHTLKSLMDVASARFPTTGPSTKVGLMHTSDTPSFLLNSHPAFSASVCTAHSVPSGRHAANHRMECAYTCTKHTSG